MKRKNTGLVGDIVLGSLVLAILVNLISSIIQDEAPRFIQSVFPTNPYAYIEVLGGLLLAVMVIYIITKRKTAKTAPVEDEEADVPAAIHKKNIDKLLVAKNAIEDKNLLLYLQWKYRDRDEPVLQREGFIYPVSVYPATAFQRDNINSVLKFPLHRTEPAPSSLLINDPSYLNLITSLKKGNGLTLDKDINTVTYALHKMVTNGKLEIECNIGHYFSSYCSSEVLEWEIRSNITKLKGSSALDFKQFEKKLPHRSLLHQQVTDPVHDGSGRSAAIGISTLIAYNHGGSYKLLVKRRAKKGVPLRSGLLHVLPGFMFQPTTDCIDDEYDVVHNIYREYLEELFNLPENLDKNHPVKHFYHDKRLLYLKSLLSRKMAKLYFTGITVNLLNLRPEICALLLITSPEWYDKSQSEPGLLWEFNEEFTTIRENIVKPEDFIGELSYSDDDRQMIMDASLQPERTVPAGAGAFWLGIDTLRDLNFKID